jgi:hypothetical protein
MFVLTIPPDVEVMDTITEKPLGQKIKFVEFVRATLLTDKRFSSSHEALEQQEAIRVAIRGKVPGDVVELHNNDAALLIEVAKLPMYGAGQQATQGYVATAYQFLSFIEAIKNAKKKPAKTAVSDDADDAPAPAKPKKLAAVSDDAD